VTRLRTLGTAALAGLALAAGCGERPASTGSALPDKPARPGRIDETMRTLGVEGLRLEGATVVIQLAPADLARSRFYRRLTEALAGPGASPVPPHESLRERYGIDLSTVEAVVFTMDPERNAFVLAAATREPVRRETWLEALPKVRGKGVLERFDTYGGVELFAPPREYAGAIAFPAPQVVAAGSTADLMKGIDAILSDATKSGSPCAYDARIARLLAAAPARAGIVVAAVPTPRLMEEISASAGGPSFTKISERAEGLLLSATARETLEVELRMFMRTPEDAAAARDEAREALKGLERILGAAARTVEARPLVRLVDDVRVGGAGAVVEIDLTVPPGAIAPLVRLGTSGGK
jgi:hypothetical protein